MTEAEGARRDRIRRLLDPAFVEGLESMPLADVRRRRDEALREREFLSYLRRLLQVRMDIVEAELARRSAGEDGGGTLVDRLSSVLSEGPKGRGRGEALRLTFSEDDLSEAEGRADRAMGGLLTEPIESVDEEALRRAADGLRREERKVSEERASVIRVHDLLQGELKRRYREDPSQIPIAP